MAKRNTSIHPHDRKAIRIHPNSPNANHPEFQAKPSQPIAMPISKPVESIPAPAVPAPGTQSVPV